MMLGGQLPGLTGCGGGGGWGVGGTDRAFRDAEHITGFRTCLRQPPLWFPKWVPRHSAQHGGCVPVSVGILLAVALFEIHRVHLWVFKGLL